jgi:hypothetical protein
LELGFSSSSSSSSSPSDWQVFENEDEDGNENDSMPCEFSAGTMWLKSEAARHPRLLSRTGQAIGQFVRSGARLSWNCKKSKTARAPLVAGILWRMTHHCEKIIFFTADFNSRRLHHLFGLIEMILDFLTESACE